MILYGSNNLNCEHQEIVSNISNSYGETVLQLSTDRCDDCQTQFNTEHENYLGQS